MNPQRYPPPPSKPAAHDDSAFFLHDVGVVILSEPVGVPTYGQLAGIGYLDALATRRGLQNQLFTPVGYGLQSVKPQEAGLRPGDRRHRGRHVVRVEQHAG